MKKLKVTRQVQVLPINELKPNKENPRSITDEKIEDLKRRIKEQPNFLELKPLLVDEEMTILWGNQRYRSLLELGYKEAFVIVEKDLTEEEKKQLIIIDNTHYGEWDIAKIYEHFDGMPLYDWGLDFMEKHEEVEVDYDILDDDEDSLDIDKELEGMASGVKKAIQIEFEAEHYEEAKELVKFWREQKLYIGGFMIEKLKEEKEKL